MSSCERFGVMRPGGGLVVAGAGLEAPVQDPHESVGELAQGGVVAGAAGAELFAALAVTRFVENATGWSIKRFVRTARRYRTVQIRVGAHTLTAEDHSRLTYATRWPRSTDEVCTSLSRVR